jgi:ABC-type multidrug transport system fused ATPase/permease subunit
MNFIKKIITIFNYQFKKKFLIILFLLIIGAGLETLGIGLILPAIDVIANPNSPVKNFILNHIGFLKYYQNDTILIIYIFSFLLLFYILKAIYLHIALLVQANFTYSFNIHIYKQLFIKYINQDYSLLFKQNSSEKLKNLTQETNAITYLVLESSLTLITELFICVFIFFLILYFAPILALYLGILLGPLFFIWNIISKKKLNKLSLERNINENLLFKKAQESLLGLKDIKLYGREAHCISEFEKYLFNIKKIKINFETTRSIPRIYVEALIVLTFCIVVISATLLNVNFDKIFPLLALFATSSFKLIPSVNRMMFAFNNIVYGNQSLNLILKDLREDIVKNKSELLNEKNINFTKEVAFKNISYQYPGNKNPVLNNVNFTIYKGDIVGIIGSSGSGKTTLVDIFTGLLKPTNGEVRTDCVNIEENILNWRKKVGYVQQNIFLTDSSIKNNIAFGIPESEINDYAIKRAIKIAQLEELINSLPLKENTLIGESGIKLSGGQRQRISIARSLYTNPEIFILDEATHALNSEIEKLILDEFLKFKNKTIIIVSHDKESLVRCNRIIKIEKKNIEEIKTK